MSVIAAWMPDPTRTRVHHHLLHWMRSSRAINSKRKRRYTILRLMYNVKPSENDSQ